MRATRHQHLSPAERFWMKVEKTASCWNWLAGTDGRGYGSFNPDGQAAQRRIGAMA